MPGLGFFSTVVVGGIIGWLASIVGKTSNQMGCLWNIAVGVVGSSLGHWIASRYFKFSIEQGFSWEGFFVGIGGSLLLIIVLRFVGVLKRNKD